MYTVIDDESNVLEHRQDENDSHIYLQNSDGSLQNVGMEFSQEMVSYGLPEQLTSYEVGEKAAGMYYNQNMLNVSFSLGLQASTNCLGINLFSIDLVQCNIPLTEQFINNLDLKFLCSEWSWIGKDNKMTISQSFSMLALIGTIGHSFDVDPRNLDGYSNHQTTGLGSLFNTFSKDGKVQNGQFNLNASLGKVIGTVNASLLGNIYYQKKK